MSEHSTSVSAYTNTLWSNSESENGSDKEKKKFLTLASVSDLKQTSVEITRRFHHLCVMKCLSLSSFLLSSVFVPHFWYGQWYLYSGSLDNAGFWTLIFMRASFHYIIRLPNVWAPKHACSCLTCRQWEKMLVVGAPLHCWVLSMCQNGLDRVVVRLHVRHLIASSFSTFLHWGSWAVCFTNANHKAVSVTIEW